MRPDYRPNLIHLHWCKSRYLLQHRMLGHTREQKLLITTHICTPPRMKGRGFLPSRPDPKPIEVSTSFFSSGGFGIRPAASAEPALLPECKILFHQLCQFGVNTCVKEPGGRRIWGNFFKLRNGFTLASTWTLCKRTGEGAADIFLKPSAPCHSILAEAGCICHRDPQVPRARVVPSLCCRRANLESWVDMNTEPHSPNPAEIREVLNNMGCGRQNIPWPQVSPHPSIAGPAGSWYHFNPIFPGKQHCHEPSFSFLYHSSLLPLPSFSVAHVPYKLLLPLWLSRGRALPSCGFQSV